MDKRIQQTRAFTLIEIVIAITILSIIVSTAYSALTQIISSKKILDDKRDLSITANSLILRLTRELQLIIHDTATPLPLIFRPNDPDDIGQNGLVLLGKNKKGGQNVFEDSITFIAQDGGQYLPSPEAHKGLVQVTYRVAQDPEKPRDDPNLMLIREEIPYVETSNSSLNTKTWEEAKQKAFAKALIFPVTENLVSFRLRYYDVENNSWTNEWGENRLRAFPSLIKISFALRSPLGKVQSYSTSVPLVY